MESGSERPSREVRYCMEMAFPFPLLVLLTSELAPPWLPSWACAGAMEAWRSSGIVCSAALTPRRAACSPPPVGCPPVEQVVRDFLVVLLGSGMPMALVEGG